MAGDTISIKFTARDQFTRVSEKMNKALARNRGAFRKLDTTMQRSANKTQKSSNKMLASLRKLGKGFAALALVGGVAQIGRGVAERALTLERQVQRQLGNVDVPLRAKFEPIIREKLLSIERRTGRELIEVSDALFEFNSVLGATISTMDDFENVATLAVGSVADMGSVAEGIAKIKKSFTEGTDTRELGVTLAAAQQVGATSVGKILATAPSVSPTVSQAGFSPQDMIVALAAFSGRFPTQQEAGTGLVDLVSSLADLKKKDPAFGQALALGLPAGTAGPRGIRAFIEEHGIEGLFTAANIAITGKKRDLALEVFTTKPAINFAKVADATTLGDIATARGKISAQLADPAINALIANEIAQTQGPLAAAIKTKGVLKDAETAIGEGIIKAVESGVDVAGSGGKISRAGDAFIRARSESEISGSGDIRALIDGFGAVLKFMQGPQVSRTRVDVEVNAGPGLLTNTLGDQTATE